MQLDATLSLSSWQDWHWTAFTVLAMFNPPCLLVMKNEIDFWCQASIQNLKLLDVYQDIKIIRRGSKTICITVVSLATVQKLQKIVSAMCVLPLPYSIFLGLLINKGRDHRCAILNIFHHTPSNPATVNQITLNQKMLGRYQGRDIFSTRWITQYDTQHLII